MNKKGMINRRAFLGLAGAGILGAGLSGCNRKFLNKNSTFSGSGKKPNFIVIFCDDMGYSDIGCFGADKHRTANIDRMAQEGMRFTSFYVTSGVCSPSRASLMTGC